MQRRLTLLAAVISVAALSLLGTPECAHAQSEVPGPAGQDGGTEPVVEKPSVTTPEAPATDRIAQAEALAAEGRALFREGRFAEAVATYLKAHRLAPTATLLYNIAYIYDRKLGEGELAADFYRRYIRSEDAEPEVVERATARLGALAAEREAERAAREAALEPAPASPGPTATAAPSPAPAAAPESGGEPGTDPKWTWGWVSVGTGAVLLLGGGGLGIAAWDAHNRFEDSRDLGDKRDLRDEGRSMAIAGDVMMGVGVAALAVGTTLLLLADDEPVTGDGTVTTGLRWGVQPLVDGAAFTVGGSL